MLYIAMLGSIPRRIETAATTSLTRATMRTDVPRTSRGPYQQRIEAEQTVLRNSHAVRSIPPQKLGDWAFPRSGHQRHQAE